MKLLIFIIFTTSLAFGDTKVVYMNGQHNSAKTWRNNLERLSSGLASVRLEGESFESKMGKDFKLSGGVISRHIESDIYDDLNSIGFFLEQDNIKNNPDYVRSVLDQIGEILFLYKNPEEIDLGSVMNIFLVKLKVKLFGPSLAELGNRDEQFKIQLDYFKQKLTRGDSVIAFAHSKGTLYEKILYDALKTDQDVSDKISNYGTIQLGSAVSSISNPNGYTINLENDLLIKLVRKAGFNTAIENYKPVSTLFKSSFLHSFEAYTSPIAEANFLNLPVKQKGISRDMLTNTAYSILQVASRLGAIQDCNDDGVEDDTALKTEDGGYISLDSEVAEGFVVADGARVCGESFIEAENGIISGNVIFNNSGIGSRCSFVDISSGENYSSLIEEAFVCFNGEPVHDSSLVVQDSSISSSFIEPINSPGASIYLSESVLSQAQFDNVSVTAIKSKFLDSSLVTGRAYIDNSTFISTSYSADSAKRFLSNGDELLSASINSDFVGTTITGIPLFLNGKIEYSNISSFSYVDRLSTSGDYYVLLVNNSEVTGSTLQGNADISGHVKSSFVKGYSGQTYRSYLAPSSRIENAYVDARFSIIDGRILNFSLEQLPFQNFCLNRNGLQEFLINGTCR